MPKVARARVPTFEAIPGRQEARQAASTGVRRGLVVGVASAAVLGLLVARTFRSPTLQDGSVQTAGASPPAAEPAPVPTPQPAGMAPGAAEPVAPAGLVQPNPYASVNPAAVPVSGPASPAGTVPAVIIAAPTGRPRPSPSTEARGGSKGGSYTDADLARVRNEAESASAPEAQPASAPQARPSAASPPPARSAAQGDGREARLREAVRAAQQRVDEAQVSADEIRREARENDDDGLQEELSDAVADLKSAQKDLARARRSLRELEDQPRPVLPPQ